MFPLSFGGERGGGGMSTLTSGITKTLYKRVSLQGPSSVTSRSSDRVSPNYQG